MGQQLQNLLPQLALTKFAGMLANCKIVWVKKLLINYFINRFNIDFTEIENPNLDNYPNFNSFFIRQLKKSVRPICTGENTLASPVDGTLYQFGKIGNPHLFTAKGFEYSLESLVANNEDYGQLFQNGNFFCMYLAPADYHRVHMPASGTLKEMIYVPGTLYSVNPSVINHIPDIFTRNERLLCLFETSFGPMLVILIGAMLVGSIHTIWSGAVNKKRSQQLFKRDYRQENIFLEKGNELGHFQMGSTVICLFPENKLQFVDNLAANTHKKFGELIGTLTDLKIQPENPE